MKKYLFVLIILIVLLIVGFSAFSKQPTKLTIIENIQSPLKTPSPTLTPTPTPIILNEGSDLLENLEQVSPEDFSSYFQTLKSKI